MRSRNESSRCDSRSYSGPPRPRTRHDSLRHAGEQGVDLIDLPCRTRVSFSQNCLDDQRAPKELTSYKRNALARLWEQHITLIVDRGACRDHLGMFNQFLFNHSSVSRFYSRNYCIYILLGVNRDQIWPGLVRKFVRCLSLNLFCLHPAYRG